MTFTINAKHIFEMLTDVFSGIYSELFNAKKEIRKKKKTASCILFKVLYNSPLLLISRYLRKRNLIAIQNKYFAIFHYELKKLIKNNKFKKSV